MDFFGYNNTAKNPSKDGVDVTGVSNAQMSQYGKAEKEISKLKVPEIYNRADPHSRVFVAMFDGTGNDLNNPARGITNIGLLKKQIDTLAHDKSSIAGQYIRGPGTQEDAIERVLDGAKGLTYQARQEFMYQKFQQQCEKWLKEDPNAKITVMSTGFSRGAEQAAGFTRMVHDRGIAGAKDPDHPERKVLALRPPGSIAQAVVMYDPVASGEPERHDRRLPPSVISGVQIRANDEHRTDFVSTTNIKQGHSADGRFLAFTVPGAHSDVGGGYKLRGLSDRSFNLATDYQNRLLGGDLIRKQVVSKDPTHSVIHDSTQHERFWRKSDSPVRENVPMGERAAASATLQAQYPAKAQPAAPAPQAAAAAHKEAPQPAKAQPAAPAAHKETPRPAKDQHAAPAPAAHKEAAPAKEQHAAAAAHKETPRPAKDQHAAPAPAAHKEAPHPAKEQHAAAAHKETPRPAKDQPAAPAPAAHKEAPQPAKEQHAAPTPHAAAAAHKEAPQPAKDQHAPPAPQTAATAIKETSHPVKDQHAAPAPQAVSTAQNVAPRSVTEQAPATPAPQAVSAAQNVAPRPVSEQAPAAPAPQAVSAAQNVAPRPVTEQGPAAPAPQAMAAAQNVAPRPVTEQAPAAPAPQEMSAAQNVAPRPVTEQAPAAPAPQAVAAAQNVAPRPVAEQAPAAPAPELDGKAAFAKQLQAAGLELKEPPVMDGTLQRVAIAGGAPGNRDGAYAGHLDGHPHGHITNFASGVQTNWSQDGMTLSDKQQGQLTAHAQDARQQRGTELSEQYNQVSAKIVEKLDRLPDHPPAEGNAYMASKKIDAYGVKFEGDTMIVPMRDINGKVWSAQTIQPGEDGGSSFEKGSRRVGNMHIIGDIKPGADVLVTESYASGASLHQATGKAVVVAFDARNIDPVVESVKSRHPTNALYIMADNDKQSQQNVGGEKATAAAEKHQVGIAFPESKSGKVADFNELHVREGLPAVKAQVDKAVDRSVDHSREQATSVAHAQRGDSAEVKAATPDGKHTGPVIAVTKYHAIQAVGEKSYIVHQLSDLPSVPVQDKPLTIAYQDGRAQMTDKAPEKVASLQR
ncbi:DUF2235 domain-containing protein [Massilia sp. CCM 9210]|uniref:KfrB domain-containing protein n=1 Tax=Massilia scottii TaxID=3057166 RepID=UPI002796C276|nr:DUF2235 domain-containing protein [Massilia sp. CCM 9210]MDQ1815785.1 DUF2235 domain-containing protein [Massilia sp. CCM 9210]